MRVFADIVAGIAGISTIAGFMVRRFLRGRSVGETHPEYQARLRREARELDDERKRLGL